jgi:hypothetical protein
MTRLPAKEAWDRMKLDCATLCGPGGPATRLLDAIHDQVPADTHIVLVGYSAGCLLIDEFLTEAHTLMPDRKFDVIWMAPAISYRRVAADIDAYRQNVRHFKEFNLDPNLELSDHMLNDIGRYRSDAYPGSLLLFVSGALENQPDTPIVGLERFRAHPRFWSPTEKASIDAVATALNLAQNTFISSKTSPDCTATKHGDFVFDPPTLSTIHRLLTEWKDPQNPDGLLTLH